MAFRGALFSNTVAHLQACPLVVWRGSARTPFSVLPCNKHHCCNLIIRPFPSYFLDALFPFGLFFPSLALFPLKRIPIPAALSLLISSAFPPPADGVDEFSLIAAYCVCFMQKLVCLLFLVFPPFVAAASRCRYRAQLFHSSAQRGPLRSGSLFQTRIVSFVCPIICRLCRSTSRLPPRRLRQGPGIPEGREGFL